MAIGLWLLAIGSLNEKDKFHLYSQAAKSQKPMARSKKQNLEILNTEK